VRYRSTLQVQWLGTSCFLLQLGEKAIFTDPFLTHQSLSRVALGGAIHSNPRLVAAKLARLPVPQAIFVGHSHYDHLLDLAECLKQPGWGEVPVFGSISTRNVLWGHGKQFTNGWHLVSTNTDWNVVVNGIRYKAIAAAHGRQLPLLPLLYSGNVRTCLPETSQRASEMRVGDNFGLLFEISNERATYTVYFIGAAHRDKEGFPDESVKAVDVAILCVPTWKLSHGYPANVIQRLKPRHIVASHFDNFFQTNSKDPEVVALADMDSFLIEAQKSVVYKGFEDMVVPAVGSILRFEH